jgi:hypothetical protein
MITIGKEDLDRPIEIFKIDDYYISCKQNVCHLHWVARTEQAREYIDAFYECLDVLIDGEWIDTYGSHEQGNPVSLPDQGYIACRYILATN